MNKLLFVLVFFLVNSSLFASDMAETVDSLNQQLLSLQRSYRTQSLECPLGTNNPECENNLEVLRESIKTIKWKLNDYESIGEYAGASQGQYNYNVNRSGVYFKRAGTLMCTVMGLTVISSIATYNHKPKLSFGINIVAAALAISIPYQLIKGGDLLENTKGLGGTK